MIEIKHRITGDVLHRVEADTLVDANLWNANLWNADLQDANLRYANLRHANLQGANLRYANLRGADLWHANLRGANLWHANLQGANLRGANLWYANLQGANLQGANLQDANLQDANLRCAVGNGREVKSAQFDSWPVVWTEDVLAIGCKQFTLDEWRNMTADDIEKLDTAAFDFYTKYHQLIVQLIAINEGETK